MILQQPYTRHETIIDGLVIEPLNAFWAAATTAITRSVLEFDANMVNTQTAGKSPSGVKPIQRADWALYI